MLDGLIAEKGTRSDYEAMVEDLWIPAFGDRPINDIKPSAIRKIIAKRSMQAWAKTVNNNLIPLRGIFQAAVDDGLLEHSPLPVGEHEPWPAEVLERALEAASPTLRLVIVTGLCSGRRVSDVIRIQHGWLKTGIMELSQVKTDVDVAVPVHHGGSRK